MTTQPASNASPHPTDVYARREAAEKAVVSRLDCYAMWLGIAKLLIVAGGIGATLTAGLAHLGLSIAASLFLALAVTHGRVLSRLDWRRRLLALNQRELRALRRESSFTPPLAASVDGDHRYAEDLEIFTQHGLFCFANRGLTAMGRRTFAAWLATPAPPQEILARQVAARELASKIDHRQTLSAHALPGEDVERQSHAMTLLDDLGREELSAPIGPIILFILPILTLAAAFASLFLAFPSTPFFALISAQLLLRLLFARRVTRLLREATGYSRVLDSYAAVLQTIETQACESPRLRNIQQRLVAHGLTASVALRRLAVLVQRMEVRNAPMLHLPLNALLLWDLHGARRLVQWQGRFRTSIPLWLDAIGEWEALCSIAALSFNEPGWTWPVVHQAGFGLLAEDLGHPLIPDHERVANDVRLAGRGTIWIVTGPNMAGKSTFLRTVGVNLVLAQAGAPVCARSFELEPLQLITSMRISDSLDKRLSLFYAELQRLKQVLDALIRGEPVFFLVDEMLKGTNTLDRQAGALALIRQLHRDGASGIVATHDLALARLADELRGSLFNHHFDGTVEGERLVFDYRLRAGACKRFNALALMRAIGIRLDEQGVASSRLTRRREQSPSTDGESLSS